MPRGENLTKRDRSKGGSNSGGNFKNDREKASEAGKIGGSR
jgi:general stress protein YciG